MRYIWSTHVAAAKNFTRLRSLAKANLAELDRQQNKNRQTSIQTPFDPKGRHWVTKHLYQAKKSLSFGQ